LEGWINLALDTANVYPAWPEIPQKCEPYQANCSERDACLRISSFTYIKTNAPGKFGVHGVKDGKSDLVTYDLRDWTYLIPKVMDSGSVELGKMRMDFSRKG
jgi:hypothetical protein